MAPVWERLETDDVRTDLRSPEARVAWSFLRPGDARVYRSPQGTIALVLPLGGWLTDRQEGLEWTPAPDAPRVAREESLALLQGPVTPEDLEELRARAKRDGVNVTLLSALPMSPAPAEGAPAGTLTLVTAPAPLSLPVYRVGDGPTTLRESPVAMRKRGEGPGNLPERERWFRSRSGSR